MPEQQNILQALLLSIQQFGTAYRTGIETRTAPDSSNLEGKALVEVVALAKDAVAPDLNAIISELNDFSGVMSAFISNKASVEDVAAGTNDSKYVTALGVRAATDAAIAALIDGAPTALNTLKELSDKLTSSDDVVSAILTQLQQVQNSVNALGGRVSTTENEITALQTDYISLTVELDTKLDRTQPAVDSEALEGHTYASVLASINQAVTEGKMGIDLFTPGANRAKYIEGNPVDIGVGETVYGVARGSMLGLPGTVADYGVNGVVVVYGGNVGSDVVVTRSWQSINGDGNTVYLLQTGTVTNGWGPWIEPLTTTGVAADATRFDGKTFAAAVAEISTQLNIDALTTALTGKLDVTGKAADSALFDGLPVSYFAPKSELDSLCDNMSASFDRIGARWDGGGDLFAGKVVVGNINGLFGYFDGQFGSMLPNKTFSDNVGSITRVVFATVTGTNYVEFAMVGDYTTLAKVTINDVDYLLANAAGVTFADGVTILQWEYASQIPNVDQTLMVKF